jgi:hypothetical protein
MDAGDEDRQGGRHPLVTTIGGAVRGGWHGSSSIDAMGA